MAAAKILPLALATRAGETRQDVSIDHTVIAGWTGRDREAVEKHILELEALGVPRPSSTPIFYRVASSRLTTSVVIEALGSRSSGEVEIVLLKANRHLWVGVGSDHTDRAAETYGVSFSKQACDKPVAPSFWLLDEIAEHWDELVLRSHIAENGTRTRYQEGTVAGIVSPVELAAMYAPKAGLTDGTLMFCGTLAALGGIRPSSRFEFELEDPVLKRKITHGYEVISLPLAK